MLSRRRFLQSSLLAASATLPATRGWPAILAPPAGVDRDLDAVTGEGKSVTLTRAAVRELGDSLRGNLILPGGPGYDQARWVWNAQMNRHPALIVQPRGAADVRSAGTPLLDTVRPIDYVALQRSGDGDEKRAIGTYTKTGFVRKIPPALTDAMLSGLEEHPQRSTVVGFQHCGGAIARVAVDAMAFPHRGIHATSLLTVDWPGEVDPAPHVKWVRDCWARIVPHTDGFHTNDATEETQKQLDENYLGNLPRLVQLKNRYDRTNLFRLNANVRPIV